MRRMLPIAAAASLLLATAAAHAQNTGPADISNDANGHFYDFRDADLLAGTVSDASGAMLRVRTTVMRRTLIRPRASFVAEMVKSVEHL